MKHFKDLSDHEREYFFRYVGECIFKLPAIAEAVHHKTLQETMRYVRDTSDDTDVQKLTKAFLRDFFEHRDMSHWNGGGDGVAKAIAEFRARRR